MSIVNALEARRSIYALDPKSPLSAQEVADLARRMTELVPDAFNMHSQRIAVVQGDANKRLWDAVYDAFGGKVARDKIDGFAAGAGTILYFVDDATVAGMQEQFPRYAENFPTWAEQANGMLQLSIWAALAEAGVGANIQHYNPVIDEAVRKVTGVPETYRLRAQMPYGGIAAPAGDKDAEDVSARVTVL